MTIKKHASATWAGEIKTGKGHISTESDALDNQPFGFNTRFEGKSGTNPEELIGAAHAGCFAMAFSLELGKVDIVPEDIGAKATVHLEEKSGGGFEITQSNIDVTLSAPGADRDKINDAFEATKKGCPVSNVLSASKTINLTVA